MCCARVLDPNDVLLSLSTSQFVQPPENCDGFLWMRRVSTFPRRVVQVVDSKDDGTSEGFRREDVATFLASSSD